MVVAACCVLRGAKRDGRDSRYNVRERVLVVVVVVVVIAVIVVAVALLMLLLLSFIVVGCWLSVLGR